MTPNAEDARSREKNDSLRLVPIKQQGYRAAFLASTLRSSLIGIGRFQPQDG